ncbi:MULTISPECIES: hypothetical protein [Flavobacteriaceae]|uniref:hypothetical protein n=1 Tax=Flavobacteriaceae TaxID=49546 RepID=UPI0010ADEF5F|nr:MULTISPECIES: hypothetical protein [Flavobacteriaceae]NJB36018.1 hypothetical protein [Croceivirga sp. JEA036]TKD59241.1 hypothetical protein FBT53_13545 [Flavobacterium sp. ASW18X]
MLRKYALLILITMALLPAQAQEATRQWLRGQVIYRGTNVVNENVINTNSQKATITDEGGRFAIEVKVGDQLVFTAVNYQLEVVLITQEMLNNGRLVVEVEEKVTELDEVIVGPENSEQYVKLKNEEFQEYEYEIDRTTEVENVAQSQIERGMKDGINFVNIFKAIFNAKNQETGEGTPLKVSEVLRHVYDDEFFVVDLGLPQKQIDAFLVYCDDKIPSQSLLKKENEFQLIDFLVTQSKNFKAETAKN